jgi:hypothetical protein
VAGCDLAVAAEGTRFATPGVKIGLFCSTPMVPGVAGGRAQAGDADAADGRADRRGDGARPRGRSTARDAIVEWSSAVDQPDERAGHIWGCRNGISDDGRAAGGPP